jgi:hypothetical protein
MLHGSQQHIDKSCLPVSAQSSWSPAFVEQRRIFHSRLRACVSVPCRRLCQYCTQASHIFLSISCIFLLYSPRRFGFANPEALAQGLTGTDCRGEEHDVTLVWSITSGKRLLLADGQEVHYSNSRGNVFDFSWTMRGNHVLKVVAHASPPLQATPGFRQYDFWVDGQSFYTFPKMFRLGLAPNDPRALSPQGGGGLMPLASSSRAGYNNYSIGNRAGSGRSGVNIASVEAPTNPDEEEAYLQEAIKQSLEDAPPESKQNGEANLIDFFGDTPAPAP